MFSIYSCSTENEKKEKYIAEVGNSKLTESELEHYLSEGKASSEYKDEFVRNWVETELLAQLAEEDGLTKSEKFGQTITSAKKELAAAFAIEHYLLRKPINLGESELKSFYMKNKDDYILANDAYVINYVEFKNEQDAIKFRDYAIHSGWNEALEKNAKDLSLLRQEKHKVLQLSEIQSPRIIRVLKKLFKNEISLVIKTELNNFAVVQHLDKLNQNNVPSFKYVKDDVARTYKIFMQQKLVRRFIDSLFTKKNIKIYKGY